MFKGKTASHGKMFPLKKKKDWYITVWFLLWKRDEVFAGVRTREKSLVDSRKGRAVKWRASHPSEEERWGPEKLERGNRPGQAEFLEPGCPPTPPSPILAPWGIVRNAEYLPSPYWTTISSPRWFAYTACGMILPELVAAQESNLPLSQGEWGGGWARS